MTAEPENQENTTEDAQGAAGDGDGIVKPKPGVMALAMNLMEMQEKMEAFETLVRRRFDEISMEINAASQQFGMVEESIGKKFGEVFETLGEISYSGDGTTAANTGVELDAVVDMTEEAATKIMDAAGRISSWTHQEEGWNTEDTRLQYIDMINKEVEEIFLACSFQDITSQRIRKTLENINKIEERLDDALERMGVHIEKPDTDLKHKGASQDDIDALFSEG